MAESNLNQANIRILADIGVPKRFYEKELASLNGYQSQIEKAAKAILDGLSVFITGPCGTGKTHFAVGLLKFWLSIQPQPEPYHSKMTNPLFISSVELFASLKSSFDSEVKESDIIAELTNAPLLILDDVGAEKVSDWSRQQFFLIVDRRYRNMLPVVVTSNLSLDAISSHMDDRLASRFSEMGEVVMLDGPDRRTTDFSLRKPLPAVKPQLPALPLWLNSGSGEKINVENYLSNISASLAKAKDVKVALPVAQETSPTVDKKPEEIEAEVERRRILKEQAERLN